MIISRTPYRISFFGGGTDYPSYAREFGGEVLSTAIDKYCYLTCRYLPPFFEHKIRVVYSKMEMVASVDEIKHPSVRETLRYLGMKENLEIHHDGDLPARSGIGSSSSFTVGLLNALYALKGVMASRERLANDAITIEQERIGECVGSQDQTAAAYGGLNHIEFPQVGGFVVRPVTISRSRIEQLESHLMLFFTRFTRIAADIAQGVVGAMETKQKEMRDIKSLVSEGLSVLNSSTDIGAFGKLLHESWRIKRSLSQAVSTSLVDESYAAARNSGAIGGKITGAGGGGFLLLFAPPERHVAIKEVLKDLLYVPFKFDFSGSQIVAYDTSGQFYIFNEKHRSFMYNDDRHEW